jgi:N-acetyl sugar amidotransferase
MKYCKRCLYPETKPDLSFEGDGWPICSACVAYDRRREIDWTARERSFKDICDTLLRRKLYPDVTYHCIVPVSGGKDSHYQVAKVLEYGLRPLAVTAATDDLSHLGRLNLDNISKLGVDAIEIVADRKLRRKINAFTLREIGDISWAEHVTIFSIPLRIAHQFHIPLIVWGENPQNEYGGPTALSQDNVVLNRRWLSEYGGLLGLRVSDLAQQGLASKEDLKLYEYPDESGAGVEGIFLGQFFSWDGAENALRATKLGFKTFYGPVEGSGYDYENLDNCQTGIHDRFKYIKYGFGRCTDIVCNHIRRGSISRREGKEIILRHDNWFPRTYLCKPLEDILEPLGMSVEEFIKIQERFTNTDLFEILPHGRVKAKFLEDLKNA